MLDAAFNFLKRHPPGLWHLATMGIEHILQFLWHTGRAMHHKMDIWQSPINFFHHIHRQNVAVWFTGEFIGPMAGAHGNSKGVNLGLFDKINGLIRVCQQLVFG